MACWYWHVTSETLEQACLEWLWVFLYEAYEMPSA